MEVLENSLKLKKNIKGEKLLGRRPLGRMSGIPYLGKTSNIKHSGAGLSVKGLMDIRKVGVSKLPDNF